MVFDILSIFSIIGASYALLSSFISHYGYAAIFGLMALEGSSLPIPSEVVLPLAGLFAAKGILNLPFAFLAALLGSIVGLGVDYYIGYYLGKDVVYKHLKAFHIKKESLDAFDEWFARNGFAAVFLSRFIPLLRTLMSFPAGFARMPQRRFFAYSITGCIIYDFVLIYFGYKALSSSSAVVILASIGVFAIALYALYHYSLKYMKSHNKT